MQDIPKQLAQHIARTIAGEIGAQTAQALAAIALLDEGASVPFIARYRKEVTGGLDDTQLRNLETRLAYLRELEDRRATVLASIERTGQADRRTARRHRSRRQQGAAGGSLPSLQAQAPHARADRARSRAGAAWPMACWPTLRRHRKHSPLRSSMPTRASPTPRPRSTARAPSSWNAGARMPTLVGELRDWLGEVGVIRARVAEGKEDDGAKYRDYFDHSRSAGEDSFAPAAGAVPRAQARKSC